MSLPDLCNLFMAAVLFAAIYVGYKRGRAKGNF